MRAPFQFRRVPTSKFPTCPNHDLLNLPIIARPTRSVTVSFSLIPFIRRLLLIPFSLIATLIFRPGLGSGSERRIETNHKDSVRLRLKLFDTLRELKCFKPANMTARTVLRSAWSMPSAGTARDIERSDATALFFLIIFFFLSPYRDVPVEI